MGNTNFRVDGDFNNDGNFALGGNNEQTYNRVGGDMIGNAIGDSNQIQGSLQSTKIPSAQDINMAKELAEIKAILEKLSSEDSKKIANALEDAEDELKKDNPDKDEVGEAIDRALNKAKKANEFAVVIDDLRPHVEAAAGWLGKNWYKILSVISLAV